MVIHAYFLTKADELHSQQHGARGFTEFPARGQWRASSAQSLPASEPLEAALPPPNSFLSLLQHPRVPAVHVKPQPAPGLWCFKEYLSLFSSTPCPLLTFNFPQAPPALQDSRRKRTLRSQKGYKGNKKLWFLRAARGGFLASRLLQTSWELQAKTIPVLKSMGFPQARCSPCHRAPSQFLPLSKGVL